MNRHLEGKTNMRDPELRSPQEWAEELREDADDPDTFPTRELSAADCRELADRMDDLSEALRLLDDEPLRDDAREVRQGWINRVDALLAKYQEEQDQQPAPLDRPAGAAEPVAGVFVLGAEQCAKAIRALGGEEE